MNRVLVRGLFAVAVAALPVQLVVREVGSEPYPGLYQPSFGGTVAEGLDYQTYEPLVTVIERDGTERKVDYRDVLPPTPVLPLSVFRSAFEDDKRSQDPQTARWLRSRLLVLDPGSDPQSATIEWVRVDRQIGSTRSQVAEVAKTVVLDVRGG